VCKVSGVGLTLQTGQISLGVFLVAAATSRFEKVGPLHLVRRPQVEVRHVGGPIDALPLGLVCSCPKVALQLSSICSCLYDALRLSLLCSN
jgi:hypothetical protein